MCTGRSIRRVASRSARARSDGPRSTEIVVTNATARMTAVVATTRRTIVRVLCVNGWARTLRTFKVRRAKQKVQWTATGQQVSMDASAATLASDRRGHALAQGSRQRHQHRVRFDRHALSDTDVGDDTRARGAQLVLHLHGFDHDYSLTSGDGVAGLDEHFHDAAW